MTSALGNNCEGSYDPGSRCWRPRRRPRSRCWGGQPSATRWCRWPCRRCCCRCCCSGMTSSWSSAEERPRQWTSSSWRKTDSMSRQLFWKTKLFYFIFLFFFPLNATDESNLEQLRLLKVTQHLKNWFLDQFQLIVTRRDLNGETFSPPANISGKNFEAQNFSRKRRFERNCRHVWLVQDYFDSRSFLISVTVVVNITSDSNSNDWSLRRWRDTIARAILAWPMFCVCVCVRAWVRECVRVRERVPKS